MASKGYVIGSKAGAGALLDGIMDRQSATGIDAKATGQTLIFTPVADRGRYVVTALILDVTAATAVAGNLTISLGTLALPQKLIPNVTCWQDMNQLGTMQQFFVVGTSDITPAWSLAASEALYLNIVTAYTGTSITISAHTLGFYVG